MTVARDRARRRRKAIARHIAKVREEARFRHEVLAPFLAAQSDQPAAHRQLTNISVAYFATLGDPPKFNFQDALDTLVSTARWHRSHYRAAYRRGLL